MTNELQGVTKVPVPTPIPVEMWGKDHWSTFAYIEVRCVDHKGQPDRQHMRCDVDLHPGLAPHRRGFSDHTPKKYPTRLKGGVEVQDHDDWSCIDDMEEAGLLKWEGSGIYPIFVLTDKGKVVAGRLRAHKANGGNFAGFNPGTI